MNVGIVSTWYESGAAYVSKAYLEALTKKHNVCVYARGGVKYAQGDPRWDADYVTWGKSVYWKKSTYIDWREFKGWVAGNGMEVLIFNEQQSWEIIVKARRRLNVLMGAYVDYYTPETVPFFRLYDFLLCNTKAHHSVFNDHPQSIYIPWGTDVTLFNSQAKGREGGACRFFHSCGLHPGRKGSDVLVKAFLDVRGDAKLILHSQIPLPRESELYREMLADRRIELIEKEAGAPGLYHLGDVYVYPTRLEGIGLTIVEALACGLPVITTDAPPMNEFVIDGLNGRLVQVERKQRRPDGYYWPENLVSQAALTESMQFYVDHPHERQAHQRQAAEHARKHFDWNKNSRELPDLLPGLIPGKSNVEMEEAAALASRYEQAQYRLPPILESLRGGLHKTGVAKIARLFR